MEALRPGWQTPNRRTSLAARLQATPVRAVGASVLPHQPYLLTKGNNHSLRAANRDRTATLARFRHLQAPAGHHRQDRHHVCSTAAPSWSARRRAACSKVRAVSSCSGRAPRRRTGSSSILTARLPTRSVAPASMVRFETHFWARLGGALLLSVVQGGLQAGVAAVSPHRQHQHQHRVDCPASLVREVCATRLISVRP